MKRINVTKSYLPSMEEYIEKIKTIWENHHLTNYGPLHDELSDKLSKYLNIQDFHYLNNGTTALQLALEAMNINDGEIITTPFSFIATASSIVWQRCTPVFVDIDAKDFNIDISKIEEKITANTKAILTVHCFGYPCNVEKIEEIAKKYNLKVIYDAAHAFGAKYKGKSLLAYGDIATCSFHATKIFHTVEGGACIVNNSLYNEKMKSIKNFGNHNGNYEYVGINAKNSEFHAAMGLCVFEHLDEIIEKRKSVYHFYKKELGNTLYIPEMPQDFEYNYIYFPVLFKNEKQLLEVFEKLEEKQIFARRYFYPSLDTLKIFNVTEQQPIAHDISKRIACLPFDTYLEEDNILEICNIIKSVCNKEEK